MDPAAVDGDWSPARVRYAQRQRERLFDYEDRLRRDLVLDERAARTAQLEADFEDFRAGIATIAATGSESLKRSRLVALQEAEAEVLRSVHADAALSTVLLPREIVDRRTTISVEEIERAELQRAVAAQAAMRAFDDVERQEARWRRVLEQQAAAEGAPMWRDAIAQQLVFLVTPAGTHAEPHYRRFIELSERRDRRALAFTFCRINAMWFEEWERMTLQLSTRCFYGYLREFGGTSREEALAREELRLLHEPLATDIREELQHRAERCHRRQNKLEALTALRRAEVNRLVAQRRSGNSEVDGWKVAELDHIADLHSQMLADLVAYSPASPPRGDSGDGPGEEEERALARHESAVGVASRVAEHLECNLDRLSHPKTAFREIVAYRKRLQGFDNFVTQVEAAIGTPEMLRSRPVLDSPPPSSMMLTGGADGGSPDASPRPITWSSRRRSQHQRYRINPGSPHSSAAPSMSTDAANASPFDLDRYEAAAATGTAASPSKGSAKGAAGWAVDQQYHVQAALVPVAQDEPSAQELIADEIRLALKSEERGGSDSPVLAITVGAGLSSAGGEGERSLLEGARRREDQEEMRALEQHTCALEALHQHLMRFV